MIATEKITCPNCKGKGHVFDIVASVFFFGLGWVFAPFETNNPNGITREKCKHCKGKGYTER